MSNNITPLETSNRRSFHVSAFARAAFLVAAVFMHDFAAAQGALALEIGAPAQTGATALLLHGLRDPLQPGTYYSVSAETLATDTATQRATALVDAINTGAAALAFQAQIVSPMPVVVMIQGRAGVQISSASRVTEDTTGGSLGVHMMGMRPSTAGMISLEGTASGFDVLGQPGGISLQTPGCNLFVNTSGGEDQLMVENRLCSMINNCGITAWMATGNERIAGVNIFSGTDSTGVFIPGISGDSPFRIQVTDTGLILDSAAAGNPGEPGRAWTPGLQPGDCSGDGLLSIIDALFMARLGLQLDPAPAVDSEHFAACNYTGAGAGDPAAIIDVLDALALAVEAVSAPPSPPSCPTCNVPAEWLVPPPTPPGYRYVGRDVVVNFVLVESTAPLGQPLAATDITFIQSKTIVVDHVLCCDIIVAHTFERIP